MSDETVIEGDLFIGDSTYVKGKWVRERDYDSVQDLAAAQRDEIVKLRAEVQLLHEKMREMMPPRIASVIESHDDKGVDYVKRVIASHWTSAGIHVVIAP